jgi:hypothetical protein
MFVQDKVRMLIFEPFQLGQLQFCVLDRDVNRKKRQLVHGFLKREALAIRLQITKTSCSCPTRGGRAGTCGPQPVRKNRRNHVDIAANVRGTQEPAEQHGATRDRFKSEKVLRQTRERNPGPYRTHSGDAAGAGKRPSHTREEAIARVSTRFATKNFCTDFVPGACF